MTGETIKEFLVGLGFDVDEAGLSKFKSGLSGAAVAAGAVATAVVAAAGAVTHFVAGVAHDLDELADFADLVGEDAAAIARLGYVASIADSSVEAVKSSIRGVSRAAGEAVIGIGRGAMAFKKLGIEAKDSTGKVKSGVTLLEEIGKKVAGLSKQEQIATLSKLGIDPTLVKTLTEQHEGLAAEFDAIYGSLGIDLTAAANAGSEFTDTMNRLKFVMDAGYKAVAIKLMPTVHRGIESMRRGLVANLPRIVAVLTPILDLVLRVSEAIVALGNRGVQALGWLLDKLGTVNDALGGVPGYILAVLAAWRYLNLGFLATPLGMILSLVAAVGLLVDDFLVWRDGGESFFDWGPVVAWGEAVGAAVGQVRDWFAALPGEISAWVIDAALAMGNGINRGVEVVLGYLNKIKEWFTDMGGVVAGWASRAGDVLGSIGGVLGFGGGPQLAVAGAGAGGASLTPGVAAQSAARGPEQNVTQKTEIHVTGGASPEATGKAVAREQGRVNGDLVRNLAGAAR